MNIDEIQNEIEKLSADDRQRLLARLLLGNDASSREGPKTIILSENEKSHPKMEGVEGAELTIQDWPGDFLKKPKIIIRRKNSQEEIIDNPSCDL